MCGCRKHGDESAECTCICPEHGNFALARKIAMERYDEVRAAQRERDQLRAEIERLETIRLMCEPWADVDAEIEGGQPNGVGEIEPSDYREWYTEARETHHRKKVTLYGEWQPGGSREAKGR